MDKVTQKGSSILASGWPFHARHGSTILDIDPYGEIVSVDVEGNVDILRVQIRTGGIVKTPHLAPCQDQSPNSTWITRPAFKPVSKMDRTQFVFVGSCDAIVAHGNGGDLRW